MIEAKSLKKLRIDSPGKELLLCGPGIRIPGKRMHLESGIGVPTLMGQILWAKARLFHALPKPEFVVFVLLQEIHLLALGLRDIVEDYYQPTQRRRAISLAGSKGHSSLTGL